MCASFIPSLIIGRFSSSVISQLNTFCHSHMKGYFLENQNVVCGGPIVRKSAVSLVINMWEQPSVLTAIDERSHPLMQTVLFNDANTRVCSLFCDPRLRFRWFTLRIERLRMEVYFFTSSIFDKIHLERNKDGAHWSHVWVGSTSFLDCPCACACPDIFHSRQTVGPLTIMWG